MITPPLLPLVETPRRTDVRTIDRELADLWRRAIETSEAERIVLSRARTLTLVLYAAHPRAGDHLSMVAARTCQRHPGRAIILVADDAEADVTAEVNAICQIRRRDHKQVCCEQVLIRAPSAAREKLPSMVRQLVLPDMPVVLYWPAPPPNHTAPVGPSGDRLFADLQEAADRTIVDTGATGDGPAGLRAVHRLAADGRGHAGLGDLTWGRLTTWRGLTATFFDPPHTAALERITTVRVGHAGSSRAQGLLYLGWLAARLRWRVEQPFGAPPGGDGPWRAAALDQRGRPVALSLHAESRAPHPAGALLSTMIVTTGEGGANGGATFSITRKDHAGGFSHDDAGGLIAEAAGGGGHTIRRALPLDPPEEAPLLAAEMDIVGHDRVFESSLRGLVALLGRE